MTAAPEHLAAELQRAGVQDVDTGTRRRAEYSSDASNYRVVAQAVAFPRTSADVTAALAVCAELGVPLTSRGAGTSIAGNAIGTGLVLDFSRHMNTILQIDPDAKTAIVQPGVILDSITEAAAPFGLRFGPDPSTHARATIGGSLGNNACGARALAYGRSADNVTQLRVTASDGTEYLLGRGGRDGIAAGGVVGTDNAAGFGGSGGAAGFGGAGVGAAAGSAGLSALTRLDALVAGNLGLIRQEFGRFTRQVSGYSLEHLLPENGADLAKFFVGTEGTLGVITEATVRLVNAPKATALAVLGYPDMAAAADAVPALLPHKMVALEGMDARLVDVVRSRRGEAAVPTLPRGGGWLFAETAGQTEAEAIAAAQLLVADAGCLESTIVTGAVAKALWRIREDGAGLGGRSPANEPAWPGWEDAAVPPANLGNYLREFSALMKNHGVDGLAFGHFGDGCVHARIDFPLATRPEKFREFVVDAAKLVGRHGGSMSGEHGDGRARGEMLQYMYSSEALELMSAVKGLFDPADLLNPGVIVRPAAIDSDLRVPAAKPLRKNLAFAYAHDKGDFTTAVHRCVGVGKCRADSTATGEVMCPSYLATRDEKDSTRARARVLQELANGTLIDGWRSPEVLDSLDLCLSCKGCSADCPAGVDMATYKSEVLHQRYRRRLRPASHYALGWLPRWSKMAAMTPRLANSVMRRRSLGTVAKAMAGVDQRRELPIFATKTFRQWWRRRAVGVGTAAASASDADGRPAKRVLLWVDSFTNHFSPEVGRAAIEVLENAGYCVELTRKQVCCGLTWISTGQLDGARRQLTASLDAVADALRDGIPIVGLEPSCTAVLRSDVVELLGSDERAVKLAKQTVTLAELLQATPGWQVPDLSDVQGVAQPHCHQHAVMGWAADEALLKDAGASIESVGGCCGLAGNFGVEKGHYDVSVAVAENALLPAVRANPDGIVLADGFSCRTQLEQLADREGLHLAQVLAAALKRESSMSIKPSIDTMPSIDRKPSINTGETP